MENSSSIWHNEKNISDYAVYELLKNALTLKTLKLTNSEQKSKQKQAILAAVINDINCLFKKTLLMNDLKKHIKQIKQHRTMIAEFYIDTANKSTLEEQRYMMNIYLKFTSNNINKLNKDMILLLVQLTQKWCDNIFIAALDSNKIQCVCKVIEQNWQNEDNINKKDIIFLCQPLECDKTASVWTIKSFLDLIAFIL